MIAEASTLSWTQPYTTTLFAPGILSSANQVEKYLAKVQDKNGQWVASNHRNIIINEQAYYSCNFAEVIPSGTKFPAEDGLRRYTGSLIKTIVQHQNKRFAALYQDALHSKNHDYSICLSRLNFGQEPDIITLSNAYDHLCNDLSMPQDIVLFGFSRGSAAAFNFIATLYPHKEIKRIKAIILEACFDSITQCISWPSANLLETILPHYCRTGIEPIQPYVLQAFVEVCNLYHIPVIFISSQADKVVAYKNTMRLYKALQQTGLRDLELITLRKSGHNGYLFDNEDDRATFHCGIHSFYKKYHLSHIPELANQNI